MTRFIFTFLSLFHFLVCQMTYRVKSFEELQKQRLMRFYSKAIDQLSKNTLQAKESENGLGVFVKTDIISGSKILEIIDEYAISSFDSIFPDHKEIRDSFHNLDISPDDQDMIMLIFNLMYYKHSKRTLNKSRFMKIFYDNIPNINYYTPTWDDIEKQVFCRIMNKTNYFDFNKELFDKNNAVINYIISQKIQAISQNKTRFLDMITWDNIKFAANIAYSRALPISYKSWKEFIGVDPKQIQDSDEKKTGFIVLAGFELINHNSDAPPINLKLKKHKIIVNAAKRYRKDEEVFVNYAFKTTNEFFKYYSFVPDNVHKEHIPQKIDQVSLYSCNNNETIFKTLCFLLDACKAESDYDKNLVINYVYYPKYISNHYFFKNVLKYWQEGPINDSNYRIVVDLIKNKEYSNITLALALSEYLEPLTETLQYLYEEGFSFERFTDWYNMTQNKDFILSDFLNELKVPVSNKIPLDMNYKIKEIVRFALYFYHNSLQGFKETVKSLNKTLDDLTEDLRDRIIDKY